MGDPSKAADGARRQAPTGRAPGLAPRPAPRPAPRRPARRLPPRRLAASFLGALSALLAAPASAQDLPPEAVATGPTYVFNSVFAESVVLGLSALSMTTYFLPQRVTRWGPYAEAEIDPVADEISDYTGAFLGALIQLGAGFTLEAAHYEVQGTEGPLGRALRTTMIESEAVMIGSGVSFAIKRFSGRCRPRAYRQGKCGPEKAEYDAFPSGHVIPVSSIAGVRLSFALRTSLGGGLRWVSFGVGEAGSIATGLLRVLAGAHSWEDVVGGWALGHGTGLLVGLLHPFALFDAEGQRVELPPAGAPSAPALSFGGSF